MAIADQLNLTTGEDIMGSNGFYNTFGHLPFLLLTHHAQIQVKVDVLSEC